MASMLYIVQWDGAYLLHCAHIY